MLISDYFSWLILCYFSVCFFCVSTGNSFRQLFPKGKIFSFGRKSVFLFQKNHPLLEDTIFKLLLWISLVFRPSTNVPFSANNHILKFFIKSFENHYQVFFFNSENLLSSIDQCTGSFIQTPKARWQVIMELSHHMKEITWKRTVYIFSFYSFF